MCCQQFFLSNIVSETTGHRALIFGIMHFLIDLYQFCSNDDHGPKMALQWVGGGGWGLGLENKIYLKYLLLPNCWAPMLGIRYVALASDPVPSLFKGWLLILKWPHLRGYRL